MQVIFAGGIKTECYGNAIMWSPTWHPRELNWKESFPAVLGTYISIPPNTVLCKDASSDHREVYHFSGLSEVCCRRFYTKDFLRLMDFRYALLLSDFQHPTVESICMYMKRNAQRLSFGSIDYVIDGILLCTDRGIHIVLFDLGTVTESAPHGDSSQLSIADLVKTFFVVNGISNAPTSVDIAECSISGAAVVTPEWPSLQLETLGLRQPNHHLDRTMPFYQSINWKQTFLPVYGSFIDLPSDCLLWRGYDTTYPPLSNRPVYFGDKRTAQEYAKTSNTHTLGLFATTRPLKLVDIRFLKVLLTDLLYERTGNAVQKTTVAFGLCSFYHQLRLMQSLYADAIRGGDPGYEAMRKLYREDEIEQPGVRVAETSNDGWVMTFLSEVFDGVADGFISPELFTPYQYKTNNVLHPEMIVFNPLKSGIVHLNAVPRTIKSTSIAELIADQYSSPVLLRAREMETRYVGFGGSGRGRYIPPIEVFNDLLNRGDGEATKLQREALKEGKKLRKTVMFSKYIRDGTEIPELPTRRLG